MRFTGRIRNGSKEVITADSVRITMVYGPDGKTANSLIFNHSEYFSGKILPGKAKSATETFAIPEAVPLRCGCRGVHLLHQHGLRPGDGDLRGPSRHATRRG